MSLKIKPSNKLNKIVCQEKIDIDILNKLLNSDLLNLTTKDDKEYENEYTQLKKYKKNYNPKNDSVEVIYVKSKDMTYGRVLPLMSLGMHSFRKSIRHTLLKEKYIDIDMVNAHPTILYNIMKNPLINAEIYKKTKKNIKSEYLKKYIDNRQKYIDLIVDTYKTTPDEAKEIFLKLTYGAKLEHIFKKYNVIDTNSEISVYLINFCKELKEIAQTIVIFNDKLTKQIQNKKGDTEYELEYTTMAIYLQEIENQLLETMYEYCVEKGYITNNNCILSNDGIMISKDLFKSEITEEFFQLIKNKYDYEIKFKVKDMDKDYLKILDSKIKKTSIYDEDECLNFQQLEFICEGNLLDNKSKIIAGCLKYKCVYIDDTLYTLKDNITYEIISKQDTEQTVDRLTSKLITKSYESLTKREQLMLMHQKSFKDFISSKYTFNTCYNQIVGYLKKDIKMDLDTTGQLHFNNGFIDLHTGEFKQRIFGKHYTTMYINRNYKKSTKHSIEYIYKNVLNKIWTVEEDRKYGISLLGRAISGEAINENKAYFWIGQGSAGKSKILEITQLAIEKYLLSSIKNDVFVKDASGKDKTLNTFKNNQSARITWINELSDKKNDGDLFKTFTEGVFNTTALYKDGSQTVKHMSVLFATMNTIASFHFDSGMERRIKCSTFTSKFVSEDSKIPIDNINVFKMDELLLSKFKKDEDLLNGFVDILVEACIEWYNKKSPSEPKSYKESTELLFSMNDDIQDFIDKHIEITLNDVDRIGKNKMIELYLDMYKNKKITDRQLLTALTDKKIKYERTYRYDGIKGCYVGVKIKRLNINEKTHTELVNEVEILRNRILQLELENKLLKEASILKKQIKQETKITSFDSIIIKTNLNTLFNDIPKTINSDDDDDDEKKNKTDSDSE